jgi:hypothetical protein
VILPEKSKSFVHILSSNRQISFNIESDRPCLTLITTTVFRRNLMISGIIMGMTFYWNTTWVYFYLFLFNFMTGNWSHERGLIFKRNFFSLIRLLRVKSFRVVWYIQPLIVKWWRLKKMNRVLQLTERSSSNSFLKISLSFFSYLDSIEISMLFFGGSVCVSVEAKFYGTINSNFVETLF